MYHMCMRAMCFHPGIFDFHQRVTFPLWALLRNKNVSAFQSLSQCFYLKKGQKCFLMLSEMFLSSSLFLRHFLGLYKNVLISNTRPPSNAIPTRVMIQKPFPGLATGDFDLWHSAKYDYFILFRNMGKLGLFWSEIECWLITWPSITIKCNISFDIFHKKPLLCTHQVH